MWRYRIALIAAGLVLVALGGGAPRALAGEWIQVSCVNPNGSAAPSEGWSTGTTGTPEPGATALTSCGPGAPMSASLSQFRAASDASEYLVYQPPAGSTLVGGVVHVNLYADGYGTSSGAAYASVYEPALADTAQNLLLQCVAWVKPCSSGQPSIVDFSGAVALPADRGGALYVRAGCDGTCDTGGSQGDWALAQVPDAELLLANGATPQASGFSGSALQGDVRGQGQLVFTATDAAGPGIYRVAVALDGRQVWAGTPNTNAGACVPAGADAHGVLMFDSQQPCPATEVIDAPVPTAGFPDGRHELRVTVIDAAGNSSPVLDQAITTSNPLLTPRARGRRAVRARFLLGWRWNGRRTVLRSVRARGLPRAGSIAVSCTGLGCPRLRVAVASTAGARRVLRGLSGARFTAGDRLRITVTAPGRRAERIELVIRDGRVPSARLLR